jgi:hypothetical protein
LLFFIILVLLKHGFGQVSASFTHTLQMLCTHTISAIIGIKF